MQTVSGSGKSKGLDGHKLDVPQNGHQWGRRVGTRSEMLDAAEACGQLRSLDFFPKGIKQLLKAFKWVSE